LTSKTRNGKSNPLIRHLARNRLLRNRLSAMILLTKSLTFKQKDPKGEIPFYIISREKKSLEEIYLRKRNQERPGHLTVIYQY
jgi:hypothetical protein